MTPERARYFASISTEERTIRRVIGEYKIRMCNSKEYITRLKNEPKILGVALVYEEAKKDVRFYNSVIKSFKKLLPAPRKNLDKDFEVIPLCPICLTNVEHWQNYWLNYCPMCGQKLR